MLAPGTLLQNRYLIVRLIAEGGMGAVYLARDQRLDNEVALKQTLFTDERMSKAFEREARLLARLRHPALPRGSRCQGGSSCGTSRNAKEQEESLHKNFVAWLIAFVILACLLIAIVRAFS